MNSFSLPLQFLRQFPSRCFSLVFPDNCRVCDAPLRHFGRIPVCADCLKRPAPLAAEYACAACRTPFVNQWPLDENGLCGLCRRGMQGFDAAFSYGAYEGRLRELIRLLKYDGIRTLAGPLAELLSAALPRGQRFDFIAPMPIHWRRRWTRGFNQSQLLAHALSRRTGIPVREVVFKRKATTPQAGLTAAQRRANVASVFEVRKRDAVAGRRVLVVDDVLTTGATASACARVLKRAGAASVTVLTVARADRRVWAQEAAGAGTPSESAEPGV